MSQQAILGPVFATMLLTLVVWVVLFARRVPFIQSSGMTPEELATPGKLAELSPASISNPSDNLKNLFELPVLFYAVTLALLAAGRVDALYVQAAWVFVAFRCLHSIVHCTFNTVMVRFGMYLISSLALWFIIVRAAWQQFAG